MIVWQSFIYLLKGNYACPGCKEETIYKYWFWKKNIVHVEIASDVCIKPEKKVKIIIEKTQKKNMNKEKFHTKTIMDVNAAK